MKNLFAIILFAGISVATVQGQSIHLAVKGGINLASFNGSSSGGTSTLVGVHVGGLVNIPVATGVSIQPEIYYSGQGARSVYNNDGSAHLHYLNVPVLLKYTFPAGFFLETGPQLGFLLSAKDKFNGNSLDVKSAFKSTDFSWAFGAGYLIRPAHVGIDMRYNLGVTNIINNPGQGESLKNGVFQIGVYYIFHTIR